ncbi:MAG: hypothetical protein Tsb0013_09460 [Phycisphaerales bacterium]
MRRTLLLLGCSLSALTLPLGGCHLEGGPRYSADRYTYVSRAWTPKTVSLIDTRTGETTWSVDVPVGQQLVVGFSQGTGPNELRPDEIVWGLMPAGRRFGSRDNRQPCPPADARRLDMALRPAPEMPGETLPGTPFAEQEPRPVRDIGLRVVEPVEEPE